MNLLKIQICLKKQFIKNNINDDIKIQLLELFDSYNFKSKLCNSKNLQESQKFVIYMIDYVLQNINSISQDKENFNTVWEKYKKDKRITHNVKELLVVNNSLKITNQKLRQRLGLKPLNILTESNSTEGNSSEYTQTQGGRRKLTRHKTRKNRKHKTRRRK